MTRATAAKFVGFIFLTLILCLPDYFPLHTDIKIQFFCLPFDPCDTTSGRGPNVYGQDCEGLPSVSLNGDGARPLCQQEPDNTTKDWFMCNTHTDLQRLYENYSLSGSDVELVLSLQVRNVSLRNVTTRGHLNQSGLRIGSFQKTSLFLCCGRPGADMVLSTPGPAAPRNTSPSSAEPGTKTDSASNPTRTPHSSQCFLHYPATAVPMTPARKVRWWSLIATVWIVLVLVVFIAAFVTAGLQVTADMKCCHIKQAAPIVCRCYRQRVKCDLPDVCHTKDEVKLIKKTDHTQGLSTIHETPVDEDEEEDKDESDSTVAEERNNKSLDFAQTPAHMQFLSHPHHRGRSIL